MQNKKTLLPVVFLVFVLLLSGCVNKATINRHPSFNIDSIKSLHIRNTDGGGNELIPVIGDKLMLMGYKVTAGDEVSPDADAIITYRDRWMWDITMYMIELTVTVRDKESNFPLATGNAIHGSLTRKTQEEMVDEVLTNLFSKAKVDKSTDVVQTSLLVSNEKKGEKLASIPTDVATVKISLRSDPMKISGEKKIATMLAEYGFCDMSRNILGSFNNDFNDNNDGTVTDKATGLMWQKSGSSSSLENRGAKRYIKQQNQGRFAGYSDWRMPTVEELASLIKKDKINGVHLDPVFDNKQVRCWSVDQCDTSYAAHSGAWIVNFKDGKIHQAWYAKRTRGSNRYAKNRINYAKAVRTVKK